MIKVNFDSEKDTYKTAAGLWQWDYGQVLQLVGMSLPAAVEIHFSLQQSGGDAITRIGVTEDGVTTVDIPDEMLENNGKTTDYTIYAFVYTADEESGETMYRISMPVKSRPRPKRVSDTTMEALMAAINKIADGKADSLEYKNNVLRLLAGEKELDRVTITGGSGGGDDAREIELRKSETALQWRYVGDPEWKDLISLEEITGVDGKSAYKYAQDGGYAGSEADFAVKLAAEYLTQETDPTVPEWAKQPEKPIYTASEVRADAAGTAESKVSEHNVSDAAHNDIRLLVQGLTERLNALADSDDITLDQMSEVVAYIKSNKSLIDAITSSKVSVSDIIDNLTTNVPNKPLSAAQGVVLKALIDGILPAVTTADNGKFLRVVDGAWSAIALTDVSEVGA